MANYHIGKTTPAICRSVDLYFPLAHIEVLVNIEKQHAGLKYVLCCQKIYGEAQLLFTDGSSSE